MNENLILFGKKYTIKRNGHGCYLDNFPFLRYFNDSKQNIRIKIAKSANNLKAWTYEKYLCFYFSNDVIVFYTQLQKAFALQNNKFVEVNSIFL